jgi:hypothetical protein
MPMSGKSQHGLNPATASWTAAAPCRFPRTIKAPGDSRTPRPGGHSPFVGLMLLPLEALVLTSALRGESGNFHTRSSARIRAKALLSFSRKGLAREDARLTDANRYRTSEGRRALTLAGRGRVCLHENPSHHLTCGRGAILFGAGICGLKLRSPKQRERAGQSACPYDKGPGCITSQGGGATAYRGLPAPRG